MTYDPSSVLYKEGRTVVMPSWNGGEESVSVQFANFLLKKGYEKGWSDGNQC